MIKKLYYIIGLIVACFATACSESLEETYDEFSGETPALSFWRRQTARKPLTRR